MDSCDLRRRAFFKGSLAVMAALAAGGLRLKNVSAQAGKTERFVRGIDDKNPDENARNLGYYSDAKKVDVKKWTRRAGPDGQKMFCKTCKALYKPKDNADADKSTKGNCPLFGDTEKETLVVKAGGWCSSWAG